MNEQLDRIEKKLLELEGKIDTTYAAAHKTYTYIKWTGIITIAFIIIPLFILPFVIPAFLSSQGVGDIYKNLGQ